MPQVSQDSPVGLGNRPATIGPVAYECHLVGRIRAQGTQGTFSSSQGSFVIVAVPVERVGESQVSIFLALTAAHVVEDGLAVYFLDRESKLSGQAGSASVNESTPTMFRRQARAIKLDEESSKFASFLACQYIVSSDRSYRNQLTVSVSTVTFDISCTDASYRLLSDCMYFFWSHCHRTYRGARSEGL